MQRELQLLGLTQLVNDLLDEDGGADVSDLILIMDDDGKKKSGKEEDGRRVQKVSYCG